MSLTMAEKLMKSSLWTVLGLVVVAGACHRDDNEPASGTSTVEPATASDGQRDGDESDVDCGGSITPKCETGALCVADVNCASGLCSSGVCTPTAGEGAEAGAPVEPDCTITNTCAQTGAPNPECTQGQSNDPTLCPPDIH